MMYGQMTAGSWIYIGSQGIVQGTYETFVEAGRQHYGGDLAGRWILTAGLGGMGGAQPLAATFAGACVAEHRVPAVAHRLSPAHRATSTSRRATSTTRWRASRVHARAKQRGLGRPARQRRRGRCPSCCARAGGGSGPTSSPTRPRRTTSSTATCRPAGRVEQWQAAQAEPDAARGAARRGGAELRDARAGDARLPEAGRADASTTATTSARSRSTTASTNAFAFPGFVPAYIRPLFCRGKGPFRWVALSGDPEDIRKTDAKMKELFPRRRAPAPLARHGRRAHRLPGPAGAHLLDRPRRAPPRRPRVQRDGRSRAS